MQPTYSTVHTLGMGGAGIKMESYTQIDIENRIVCAKSTVGSWSTIDTRLDTNMDPI
jgi:hypothetical protein